MDASKRLDEALRAFHEGRYEDALRGYEWFHRRALKHQPGLYGVRLSFALFYWIELGKVYPRARHSLERISRGKAKALREGRGTAETFHDVASINQYLGKELDTYRLFARLSSRRPRLAAKCARHAMPALVRAGDFKLARRHLADPEARVARHAGMLNREIPRIPARVRKTGTKAPIKHAYVANYCDDVSLLSKVLKGAGERERSARLKEAAAALITIPSVRRLVAQRLRR